MRVENDIEQIDQISEVLFNEFPCTSVGYRYNIAHKLCRFLNWGLENGVPNPADITASDVKGFLFDIADAGRGEDYIKQCHSAISKFYKYLIRAGVKTQIRKSDFENGLLDIILPDCERKNSHKINDLDSKYAPLFIETAIRYQPRIAFAIYLSLMSGLRGGELMNLSKSSITAIGPFGKDGLILDVKKRPLREDIGTGGVKRTRIQKSVALGQFGAKLYEEHLKHYTSDNNNALFVNSTNDAAMTVQEYSRRFRLVKKHFIEALKQSDSIEAMSYAIELENSRWNAHICRGFFTNRVAEKTNNPLLIAAYRGDLGPTSSMDYLQQHAKDELSELNQIFTDSTLYQEGNNNV